MPSVEYILWYYTPTIHIVYYPLKSIWWNYLTKFEKQETNNMVLLFHLFKMLGNLLEYNEIIIDCEVPLSNSTK